MTELWDSDLHQLIKTNPLEAENLLLNQIRKSVTLKVPQEKSSNVKRFKRYWDLIEPKLLFGSPNCHNSSHLTLLFNESPVDTAHMKLIFQYALSLQYLDDFDKICLVGTQEYLPIEPSNNYNNRLYDSYRQGILKMANQRDVFLSSKIEFSHFLPHSIPECILTGPILRFRGFAEWNDPVRYMRFLSERVKVISATYSTRVKPDGKEHIVLVRNSNDVAGEKTKYFEPPLIVGYPRTATIRPDNLTIFTILSGARIRSILRSFTKLDWEAFRDFFLISPETQWHLIGAENPDLSKEYVPDDLRNFIKISPFTDLSSIDFTNSILLFPKGALGGGRIAMEALSKGAAVFGISNNSEIEESLGVNFFFTDYSSLFKAISHYTSDIGTSVNIWIKQWENVQSRTNLEKKALELLAFLKIED